ncbi:uncharacterized protein LOC129589959 [Paramacrobiotus metropolitanus]|uniref:uncharacterized protein LOC129589959 n=1 Tax=Paramacrobiotus metropolitanus TaxID=2943436 RepID=UPI0024464111|nr:uncharacterized protein LOC129589959 [Paramacrobiotus metropolitanus]
MLRDTLHKEYPNSQWFQAVVPVSTDNSGSLVFRVIFGRSVTVFALDAVVTTKSDNIFPSHLPWATKSITCDFRVDLCGWTNYLDGDFSVVTTDNISYAALRHRGTLLHPGYKNRSVKLGSIPIRSPLPLNTTLSFRYWFSNTGIEFLRVLVAERYTAVIVWEMAAESHNVGRWLAVDLPLCLHDDVSVHFLGAIDKQGSEIRLADIVYHGELSGSAARAHACTGIGCTFDQSMCGWSNQYSVSSSSSGAAYRYNIGRA